MAEHVTVTVGDKTHTLKEVPTFGGLCQVWEVTEAYGSFYVGLDRESLFHDSYRYLTGRSYRWSNPRQTIEEAVADGVKAYLRTLDG